MAVAVVGISLSGPLTALVVAPALAIAFWRNAAGAAVLTPVLLVSERRGLSALRWRDLRSSLLAGLFLAGHFAAWLPSLNMTSVAASIALVTTTPVWTTLIARMSGVRLPAQVWWGLALAVFGGGADRRGGLHGEPPRRGRRRARAARRDGRRWLRAGRRAGAGAAVDVGLHRHRLLDRARSSSPSRHLLAGVPLSGFSARDWWLIAAITFVAQLLGHTLFNLVVPSVGPTIVSLAILLEVPGR